MKALGNDDSKSNENAEVTNKKGVDKFLLAIVVGAILLVRE